jgi:predicted N-acetyltransferase YhbS
VILHPPTEADLDRIGAFMDRAFSGYRETVIFDAGPAALFRRWSWDPRGSVVAVSGDEIVGAAMVSYRVARWRDQPLAVAHVGPVGVAWRARRRGLATAMMERLAEKADALGADLLTLTTQQPYEAWRLYHRLGYRTLETYRPPWKSVEANPGAWDPALDIGEAAWRARLPDRRPRDGAIAEEPLALLPEIPGLLVRWIAVGDAGIATLRWPVFGRSGPERRVLSVQILEARGGGVDLARAVIAAERAAAADGAAVIFYLPSSGTPRTGFNTTSAAQALRMCRPLTEAGRAILAAASAYDERSPAP